MKLLIQDSQNRVEFIFANESWDAKTLRKAIKEKYNLGDDDEIELVFNGNILEDDDKLLQKGITDGKTINFLGHFDAGKSI